jgi:hypothetical protein
LASQTAAAASAASAAASAAAATLKEVVLAYGANGNVAWDASQGTIAYLALTVPVTILGLPTGLGLSPVALTVMADQDATGNRQIIFAAGYRVKGSTQLAANTRTIYSLIKRAGANGQVTGGPSAEGIALNTSLAAPTGLLTSAITSSSVRISWNTATGAAAYNLYQSGVKVNTVAITGLDYPVSGLTANTLYSWTVRSLANGEESVDSAVISATTTALAGGAAVGIIAAPAIVSEIFFEVYRYPQTFSLNDIDSRFNTAILFTSVPSTLPSSAPYDQAETNAPADYNRDNLGDGRFQFTHQGQPNNSNEMIRAWRAQGKRMLLAVGGAKAGFNFNTPLRAANCLQSLKNIINRLGNQIDGIYWNTFELYMRNVYTNNPADCSQNTASLVWISQQLRTEYGPNFTITMAPAGGAPGNAKYAPGAPYDIIVAKALRDAVVLNYLSPQYYDNLTYKDLNDVSGYHQSWVAEFGADKVVMGLSNGNLGGNYNDCMTPAENDREVIRALQLVPGTRGFYLWSMHDKAAATSNTWITSMVAKFGNTTPVPATPPATGEQAAIDAFAYSGGQNGAWFDMEPARLRQGTLASSAVHTGVIGLQFGRAMDRSANGNDLYSTYATDQWPVFNRNSLSKAQGSCGSGMVSTTGGGSGESAANGFTLCMAIQPRSYYFTAWSDMTSAFNGRFLKYDSDENGFVFSVGTGTARVQAVVSGLGTFYVAPGATAAYRVKAWHDRTANTINLQVNDGAVVTVACPAFAAGSANFTLPGTLANPLQEAFGDLYASVHVFSALTPTLRDNLSAYVNSKMV